MASPARSKSDQGTRSILHLVKQVQYKAYVRLESVLNPLGVTAVQFRILTTLSTRPDLSSAELARLYGVKPQTMIKQIAMLESKGLIDRRVSEANKRLLELRLTPAGTDALAKLQRDSRALEKQLLKPLGNREQNELRDYLLRLLDSLNASTDDRNEMTDAEEFTPEYRRAGVQRL